MADSLDFLQNLSGLRGQQGPQAANQGALPAPGEPIVPPVSPAAPPAAPAVTPPTGAEEGPGKAILEWAPALSGLALAIQAMRKPPDRPAPKSPTAPAFGGARGRGDQGPIARQQLRGGPAPRQVGSLGSFLRGR